MSKQIVRRENLQQVRDLIIQQRDQIAMALPKHLSVDRLSRIAITAIRKTPRLMECTPMSLLGAVIQAAQLGLEPDGMLGQAYLVPYKREATLQIGYRGMIDLARRSDRVKSIAAHVVYEGDEFEYSFGLNETLHHVPNASERGDPLYVYAVAQLADGGHAFDVLTIADIEKARSSSQAGNSGPWRTHWDEMARKTAIRRLFKYLPISVEMARATALDEAGDAGIPQRLDLVIDDAVVTEREPGDESENENPTAKKEAEMMETLRREAANE
ncbi:MAG: recombination protein RecT [Deltaproteobacteria bacterium]|nr:recombination protein RecT [Deltaproteobacteria bacterium]